MPTDDLALLDQEAKNSAAYYLCVGAAIAIPAAVGAIGTAGNPLAIAGLGAAGYAAGLKACPWLVPAIKQKFFSSNARMSDAEFVGLIKQTEKTYPRLTRTQTLAVLRVARMAVISEPDKYCS